MMGDGGGSSATDVAGADGPGLSLTLCVLLPLCLLCVTQRFWIWYRLSHVPGPVSASLWKGWMLRHTLSGRMNLELKKVCDQYGERFPGSDYVFGDLRRKLTEQGSLARVGPNELVTSDLDILRRVWGVRSPYRRGAFYDAVRFDPSRDNLISLRDDLAHTELKAKMAMGYAGKENEGLEQRIDNQIAGLVDLIERKYISSKSDFRQLDFAKIAQYFTLDVITDVAFGRPFGYIATDSDVHEYIKMTEDSMPVIMVVSVFPWLAKVMMSPVFKFLLPSEKDKLGFGKFMGVAKEVVAERFGPHRKVQRDMLGSFIAHGLTQQEAGSESLLQILAGSDTTATAIRSTMLYLITSPRSYLTLQNEIDNAVKQKSISSPITDAEGRKLPYLQAVIKEGLRIFPPVAGLMLKEVPKGGDVLNGIIVPGGSEIGYCAWGVHQSKEIFGQDAGMFRPERWLEADGERLRVMNSTVDLVFNYGKWQCPGKTVAAIELNKVFVELLRRFDFCLVNPTDPWKTFNAGIFIQSNLFVRVTKRRFTRD